ncbi:hypothetical protein BDV95DRAFT_612697 [Massariosphaeria phaeospora]|uniref:Uncharacterized protein n=1 Tax=Massariosphaeria phaeospora TaxID=100035 RepID=A0A7C8M252_9PLEO|nr:hypothetical protein BDV95DRAFT_612697 [Massariosphaeria phaeospora]
MSSHRSTRGGNDQFASAYSTFRDEGKSDKDALAMAEQLMKQSSGSGDGYFSMTYETTKVTVSASHIPSSPGRGFSSSSRGLGGLGGFDDTLRAVPASPSAAIGSASRNPSSRTNGHNVLLAIPAAASSSGHNPSGYRRAIEFPHGLSSSNRVQTIHDGSSRRQTSGALRLEELLGDDHGSSSSRLGHTVRGAAPRNIRGATPRLEELVDEPTFRETIRKEASGRATERGNSRRG